MAERFTATIKAPHKGASPGCYVQLSLPKFSSGSNFAPIDLLESQKAIQRLERELCEIGIRTSLKTANLARLDLFRNRQMDEAFSSYQALFPYMKGHRRSQHEWDTTFLWKNTQQQTLIYDKGVEIRCRGDDVSVCPANTMRCEHGFLNGSKIKSVLRGKTVENLWSEYGNLGDIYNHAIRQTLFKTPLPNDNIFAGSQLESEMRAFQSIHGRNWLPAYLQAQGAAVFFEQYGSETFSQAFAALIGCDRKKSSIQQRLYRTNRDMNRDVFQLMSLRTIEPARKTLGALRRELESKFLTP